MSLLLSLALQAGAPLGALPSQGQVPVPPPSLAAATDLGPDACYRMDDRVADFTIGATVTSSGFDFLTLNSFQTPAGGDTITSLECQLFGGYASNPYAGGAITWCIYEDPTDDNNPSDAQLVWSSADTGAPQASNTRIFQSVAVPNISVDGIWWAGVVMHGVQPGEFPIGFSTEVPSFGRSWEVTANIGAIDIANLTNNGYIDDIANGCCEGVFHIRATGAQCIDLSGCYRRDLGVPDVPVAYGCSPSNGATTGEFVILNSYDASGGSDQIQSLSAQFGDPQGGACNYDPSRPIQWAIWDDPNDDGNPSDLVLLWSATDMVGADLNAGTYRSIPVPDVAVDGTFFIGIEFLDNPIGNSGCPASIDTSAPAFGRSWVGFQTGASCGLPIDLADLSTAANLVQTTTNGALPDGPWLLRATGRNCDCGTILRYCTAAPNSVSATGARMGVAGSTSLQMDDLILSASNCPPNAMGILISGDSKLNFPLSDGFLCVFGVPIRRLTAVQADAAGDISVALDQMAQPPGYSIAPGETWNFQFWYRDQGGSGANLTDALAVTFCP